ncbi:MAG TPA: peptide chain release factor N(5)-glutamine methyltransferase [Planctomycetota bacterium]|nr:peptide chain release factor N(5)-glutamine methyltransferase [Planctomycetota bacterium]
MTHAGSKDAAAADSGPRTAGEMLRLGREFLERKQFSEARLEAELLVAHALGIDRLRLFLELDRPLAPEEVTRGRALLSRRARREPVAYITGQREFYARPFQVDAAVLIPRPETELLVDRAREIVRSRELAAPRCLDVGTGSGVIALTLALEIPSARVVAVDVSATALAVARANAKSLGVAEGAVEFLEGDGALAARERAPFDLVLSNPPYIALESKASLAADVRDHEPALALFSPAGDPHHWLRRLLAEAPALMTPGGVLLIEIGHDQGDVALELARGRTARVHKDLEKLPRMLEVTID